jgi:hypothetical protein
MLIGLIAFLGIDDFRVERYQRNDFGLYKKRNRSRHFLPQDQ